MVGLVLVASCQTLKRWLSAVRLIFIAVAVRVVVIVAGMLCRVRAHNFQFCRKWDCTMVVAFFCSFKISIYLRVFISLFHLAALPPVRRSFFSRGRRSNIDSNSDAVAVFYFIFIFSLSFDHCYFFAHIIYMVVIVRLLAKSGAWIWHIFIILTFLPVKMLDLHGNATRSATKMPSFCTTALWWISNQL